MARIAGPIALSLCLAACGTNALVPHEQSGGRGTPVQVIGRGCESSSSSPRVHCVYTLTDGRRYDCSQPVGGTSPTPAGFAASRFCRRLTSVRVPADVVALADHAYRVKQCLVTAGLRTIAFTVPGGDTTGSGQPEAEIDTRGALIALAAGARGIRPYPSSHYTSERRGPVTIIWLPGGTGRATIRGCAYGRS